jgi:gliding motility-associated-like protein
MSAILRKIPIFFFSLFTAILATAQPLNDECTTATEIQTVGGNYCSAAGFYSTIGATTGSLSGAECFTVSGTDVWFSFIATATDARVSILGSAEPPGTLASPEVAFYYTTDCSSYSELLPCRSNIASPGSMIATRTGLIPGERYYIRVQGGRNNASGRFKLCLNLYNPPATADADCPRGAVLCDKSPFSIPALTNAGNDNTELSDANCFGSDARNAETRSVWLRWTCRTAGTLTFNITPSKPEDDIDFALYELPNGLTNCTGKRLVRCMASGDTRLPSRCMGTTGLRDGESDTNEPAGCSNASQSNYLSPLNMEAGKTYSLCINNYDDSGQGFSIDFGGTGTFVGPEPKITLDKTAKKICIGEDITFTDASSFALGRITEWAWRFGRDASLGASTAKGPHRVFYKTPGWKSVVLTVTTDRGCKVTTIEDSILVEGFKYDSLIRKPLCIGGGNGMIRLKVTSCGRPPIRYNWENTGYTTRDSIAGLGRGRYRVAVTDSSGIFVDTVYFNLKELEVELDTSLRIVEPPKCFGDRNGIIRLSPITGLGPFRYNWNDGRGFVNDSFISQLRDGQYTVQILDANQCKGNFVFDVVQPPRIGVEIDSFNISCFGRTDGKAVAHPFGGNGRYRIAWNTSAIGDTVYNLRAGRYSVFVEDTNKCFVNQFFNILEPPQLFLDSVSTREARCFGDSTAGVVVKGLGGTPPYRFSIDGVRFQRDSIFSNIPAKNYTIVVRDSTGCKQTLRVNVPQPPQLQVNVGPDLTLDLGFTANVNALVVPSTKAVQYSWQPADSTLSCRNCPEIVVSPVQTTRYTVTVQDSTRCRATDDLLVTVLKKRPIYIPNVFSPNGDGKNDFFTLYGNQAAVMIKELRIFNRWGDLVYEGLEILPGIENIGWNGTFNNTALPPDVYAFYARVRFVDDVDVIYKGDITIIK